MMPDKYHPPTSIKASAHYVFDIESDSLAVRLLQGLEMLDGRPSVRQQSH